MIEVPQSVKSVPAGVVVQPQAGDFILTHEDKITSKLIRFGQGIRFRGELKKFAYWNHAAWVLADDGTLVEALGDGIKLTKISKYATVEYTIVRPIATGEDIHQAHDFAVWAVGKQYGYFTIAALCFWCLFGGRLDFSLEGTEICSGLVARCLERSGHIFDRNPTRVMPADLARHFQVAL